MLYNSESINLDRVNEWAKKQSRLKIPIDRILDPIQQASAFVRSVRPETIARPRRKKERSPRKSLSCSNLDKYSNFLANAVGLKKKEKEIKIANLNVRRIATSQEKSVDTSLSNKKKNFGVCKICKMECENCLKKDKSYSCLDGTENMTSDHIPEGPFSGNDNIPESELETMITPKVVNAIDRLVKIGFSSSEKRLEKHYLDEPFNELEEFIRKKKKNGKIDEFETPGNFIF